MAGPEQYNALVLDHFQRPRNTGSLPPGSGVIGSRAGNREAGAEVHLSVRLDAGVVADARFQAFGCPHFLAAASLATERLRGLDAEALSVWQVRSIGIELEVPVEKRGRLLILEDAVRAAAHYFRS